MSWFNILFLNILFVLIGIIPYSGFTRYGQKGKVFTNSPEDRGSI